MARQRGTARRAGKVVAAAVGLALGVAVLTGTDEQPETPGGDHEDGLVWDSAEVLAAEQAVPGSADPGLYAVRPSRPAAAGFGPARAAGLADPEDLPVVPTPRSEWEVARDYLVSAPWEPEPGEDQTKIVYLTFDDGPDPVWTPRLLRLLARHNAKATFFMLGRMQREYSDLAGQVAAAGHRIGNHTDSHPDLTRLSDSAIRAELAAGADSACFRPPYGSINARVQNVVESAGMRVVLWDVDPWDWKRPGARSIAHVVQRDTTPGAVVLLHDGGGARGQTVQAVAGILPTLAAEGYEFHALPC